MTHPGRNFFILSLLCVFMFVWPKLQGFESSDNKKFLTVSDELKEETKDYTALSLGVSE
jgi:hypothetical protein